MNQRREINENVRREGAVISITGGGGGGGIGWISSVKIILLNPEACCPLRRRGKVCGVDGNFISEFGCGESDDKLGKSRVVVGSRAGKSRNNSNASGAEL